jgi:hypothetical protein
VVEAFHQAKLDRITGRLEHNRNCSPRAFSCEGPGGSGRRDYGDLSVDEIGR